MSNSIKNKSKFLSSSLLVCFVTLFPAAAPCAAADCATIAQKCKLITQVPAINWADCEGLSKAECDDRVNGWAKSWGLTAFIDLVTSAEAKRNAACGLFGRTESDDVAEQTPAYDCQAYWANNMPAIPLCDNSAKSMKLWGKCS